MANKIHDASDENWRPVFEMGPGTIFRLVNSPDRCVYMRTDRGPEKGMMTLTTGNLHDIRRDAMGYVLKRITVEAER